MMQDLVGIVRNEKDLLTAVENLQALKHRADRAAVVGNREYNPGWHTALDLHNLLVVSEAVARTAVERKESRGAHFREDCPDKVERFGKITHVVHKGPDGEMQIQQEAVPALSEEQRRIIEENK
jgi:succinate dehydrogenase / fumarate reductase flavoprotein subunit